MAFDGIITSAMVAELNSLIIDSRVEKIYLPNKNEIILSLRKNRENLKLLFSIDASNARFHITNTSKENPAKPPQFCMVLRKHLQGAKLLKISQYGLDRVIEFVFENIDELGDISRKSLYIELMGKYSNIILINNAKKIIDSMRHVDSTMSSIREVLPARDYILPTTLDKSTFIGMDYDQFLATLQVAMMTPSTKENDHAGLISNQFIGFSRLFVQNLLDFCNFENTFSNENTRKMFTSISILLNNCNNRLVKLINIGKDYHIDLNDYSTSSTLLSEFLDKFYSEKENKNILHGYKQSLSREVLNQKSKYDKNLKRVNEIIAESKDMEKYKEYGELLSSNIYRMQSGLKEIEVENFFDNNNPIVIPLNESFSPSKNTQQYFKKYTKLKNSLMHANVQKEDYENNLDYLETILYQIEECENVNDVEEIRKELIDEGYIHSNPSKKKKVQEISMPHKYEMNGIEILVGKNNIQNEKLTLKEAKKTYTWLHTKNVHGSHVIIKSDEVPDDVLLYAAELAVKHSQGKNSSKIEVDYTLVKNVRKLPGGKPGKVTYTNYKTIVI
ncbi:MAG: NFACT family protein [Clostridia bacterium]|nr:NFACT family protein [Clostridia bacterium]